MAKYTHLERIRINNNILTLSLKTTELSIQKKSAQVWSLKTEHLQTLFPWFKIQTLSLQMRIQE